MAKAVIGIVDTQAQAELIVSELRNAGFSGNDISALFPDKGTTRDFAFDKGTKAPEGAAAGAATGGLLGGTLGLLAGIGALAIPGLGPFIAAGPLLAALSGAAAGATVGGLTGALIGLGIPEVEAKRYENKVKGGSVLLAIHADDRTQMNRAEQILKANGAVDVSSTSEASVPKDQRVSR